MLSKFRHLLQKRCAPFYWENQQIPTESNLMLIFTEHWLTDTYKQPDLCTPCSGTIVAFLSSVDPNGHTMCCNTSRLRWTKHSKEKTWFFYSAFILSDTFPQNMARPDPWYDTYVGCYLFGFDNNTVVLGKTDNICISHTGFLECIQHLMLDSKIKCFELCQVTEEPWEINICAHIYELILIITVLSYSVLCRVQLVHS